MSAELASVNRGDYCVSKAGLAMAAKVFATRLAGDGIPVFEVRPGIIATDMTANVKDVRQTDREWADSRTALGAAGIGSAGAMLRGDFPRPAR